MGGFRNPIIGGGGALVYPSIHSPNYSAGSSGWSVNKDGSAEFQSLIVRETGGRIQLVPSGDTTGLTDTFNIGANGLSSNGSVLLLPGTWYLATPLNWTTAELAGCGTSTIIQPGSAWSGTALLEPDDGASICNLYGYGGSATRSDNAAADFIAPAAGADWLTIADVRCDFMNGSIFNGAPSQGIHWDLTRIRGEHNGGGIRVDNGTGSSVTAEVNIVACNIQNCETAEVLFLSSVTDVLVSVLNGSIKSGAAVNGITVQGACQTIELRLLDVGGGAGTAVLVMQQAGSNSPSDVFAEGKVQSGKAGCVISDSCARLTLQLWANRNQGSGFVLSNTGADNVLDKCGGNNNNQAAGTAYDLDITSTGHWLVDSFRAVSGAVTANRHITSASNHVLVLNDPAGTTTAGQPASGAW